MKIVQKILLLLVFIAVILTFLEIIPVAPSYKEDNPWRISEGTSPLMGLMSIDGTTYPEHTHYAFEQLALSSDLLKVNLRLTADDQLITSEEGTINGLTNVDAVIRDKTYAELIQYNYAVNYVNSNGEKIYQGLTEEDPLLARMVPANLENLFQTYPNKQFILEMNDDHPDIYKYAVKTLKKLIETYHMEKNVIVYAQSTKVKDYSASQLDSAIALSEKELVQFLSLNLIYLDFFYTPKNPVVIVPYQAVVGKEALKWLKKLPGFLFNQITNEKDGVIYYDQLAYERIIKEAHRHNLAIIVSGVTEEETMKDFIKMGIDGIITNKPLILAD